MALSPATTAGPTAWSLEVVRGRDVGRLLSLRPGENLLGNRLEGAAGLDLAEQEAGSPRRMAARQALIEARGPDLLIRDLDSPGGTFVNLQRLLASQSRRLQTGDEIQLGGVRLRVVAAAASPNREKSPSTAPPPLPGARPAAPPPLPTGAPTPAAPGRPGAPFEMGGSVACRTWDDFLTVAAQRWRDLRDELESGRLGEYLRQIRRTDLLPAPLDGRSPDARLDEWLARLPVTRSSAPELDVHPDELELRHPSGGTVRRVLRIANVGYRLLRSTVRIEPPGTAWLRLDPAIAGRPFETVEETEVPIEVEIDHDRRRPMAAELVVESNGGTRRIPVRIAPPDSSPGVPELASIASPGWTASLGESVAARLRGYPPRVRIMAGALGAVLLRIAVTLSGWIPIGLASSSPGAPRLVALAALLAAAGAIAGLILAGRGTGEAGVSDRAAGGVAGACLGVLVAAVLHALVRTVEGTLGEWAGSGWAVVLFWAALGVIAAGFTVVLLPDRHEAREVSP